MAAAHSGLFASDIWTPALEKYGGVTHLTVSLYDADERLVCGPIHPTPVFDLLAASAFGANFFAECAHRCLQDGDRPASIRCHDRLGLGVVGTSLSLNGRIVGAAVAGYHLLEFPQSMTVERLALETGAPAARVWDVARRESPVTRARSEAEGELLQVFGEALLSEIDRTRQYAELAARLQVADAAKDEFLAMVSHELRGPLNAILGWARLVRNEQLKETAREHALETIERNARHQVHLIEELLDVSRILAGKVQVEPQPIALRPLIEKAVQNVSPSARAKGIRLECELDDVPESVDGDAGLLQQVASNLLTNAVKFTPPGGTVFVRLRRAGSHAEVSVADTGEGISADFLPHVFEAFRQQDASITRVHGGLGLGLTIVRQLVALHGGSIQADSAGVGQGATFTVRLPLVTAAPALARAEDRPAAARTPDDDSTPALDGVYVLVVEDDTDARELLQAELERAGAYVIAVISAAEAYAVLDRKPPDIVVSDIGLPGEDGYAFMRNVRSRGSGRGGDVPAIAVTAWASTADRDRAWSAGYQQHLPKPVDASRLVRAIASLVERGTSDAAVPTTRTTD